MGSLVWRTGVLRAPTSVIPKGGGRPVQSLPSCPEAARSIFLNMQALIAEFSYQGPGVLSCAGKMPRQHLKGMTRRAGLHAASGTRCHESGLGGLGFEISGFGV